jgi:membrane-bound ClpP family serine protease
MIALIFALLVAGAALLVAEAHLTSYGALGLGGVVLITLGGILAVDAAGGSVLLALALILPVMAASSVLVVIAARKALAVSRLRARGGADGLVGRLGVVRKEVAPLGAVLVEGELWRARRSWFDDEPALREGEQVVVERVHGLTLSVRRAEEWELP